VKNGSSQSESIGKPARGLRQRAEDIVSRIEGGSPRDVAVMSLQETKEKLHELLVHQIELEMQNDELRRTRTELEDARARYQDLYDLAPVGYCTLSEAGLIRETNLTAARLLGVNRSALIGRPFSRLIVKENQDVHYLHRRRLIETGQPQAYVLQMMKGDGTTFWADITAITLLGGDGTPISRVALCDATLRRLKDEALRESQQRALALVEELQEADRNKNAFLSMLSHEIRNPLASISAAVALLETTPDREKATSIIDIMKRQTAQLCRLVDDLLDITRISFNRISLNKKRIDLCEIVASTALDYRAQFEEKGVRLKTGIIPGHLFLEADPARVVQVIGNLLHNALKFTKPGGDTLLTVSRQGNLAVIRVKDNGLGMKPEGLPGLFQPFMQMDDSIDRSQGGLGLGLAIVKSMVELHGGSVSAHSEGLGKGTQFTVLLPLSSDEQNENEEDSGPAAPATSRSFRILCIEDNKDFADILCSALQYFGHEVISAGNGIDGISAAKGFVPEVILCDIGLPGMSGYEVAKAIRSDSSLSGAFMIALTGYAGTKDTELAVSSGFNKHVSKPVDIIALNRMLQDLH